MALPLLAAGSNYALTTGGPTLQVGPASSARVSSLKYQGVEMLYLNSSGTTKIFAGPVWLVVRAGKGGKVLHRKALARLEP